MFKKICALLSKKLDPAIEPTFPIVKKKPVTKKTIHKPIDKKTIKKSK